MRSAESRLQSCPDPAAYCRADAPRQAAFIAALSEGHPVRTDAANVGLSARSAYLLRNKADAADFALAWDAAVMARAERLERRRWRALHGETQTIFYHRGRLVGERVVHDNRLLVRLLDRHFAKRRMSVAR